MASPEIASARPCHPDIRRAPAGGITFSCRGKLTCLATDVLWGLSDPNLVAGPGAALFQPCLET